MLLRVADYTKRSKILKTLYSKPDFAKEKTNMK